MDSSSDSEVDGVNYKDEQRDTVNNMHSASPVVSRGHRSSENSEERDNFDGSGVFDGMQSLDITN